MTKAGFLVNYSVAISGDGETTVFSLTLEKKNVLGANGTLNSGGADIGSPIDVGVTSLLGATLSLSGLIVTITFATAPTGTVSGLVQVIYG
jgi:hypothetical protein